MSEKVSLQYPIGLNLERQNCKQRKDKCWKRPRLSTGAMLVSWEGPLACLYKAAVGLDTYYYLQPGRCLCPVFQRIGQKAEHPINGSSCTPRFFLFCEYCTFAVPTILGTLIVMLLTFSTGRKVLSIIFTAALHHQAIFAFAYNTMFRV